MAGKRQREQTRLEPDPSQVHNAIPGPVPAGSLPVRGPNPTVPGQHERQTGPWGSETPAPALGGLYIISVAARLLEMHPQTLRKYERVGLVSPPRTVGMLRLYSQQDIARLRLIKHLVEDMGINLAGVEFVLGMFNRLREASQRIAALEEEQRLKETVGREFEMLLEVLDIAFADSEQG